MTKYLRALVIFNISILFLIGVGCSKKSVESDYSHLILGRWHWLESYGGIGGVHLTPDSVGYTKAYVFQPNHTFLGYRNDSLISQAEYTIIRKLVWNKDTAEVLQIPGFPEQIIGFRENDTLDLMEHVYDGFVHMFVRRKGD